MLLACFHYLCQLFCSTSDIVSSSNHMPPCSSGLELSCHNGHKEVAEFFWAECRLAPLIPVGIKLSQMKRLDDDWISGLELFLCSVQSYRGKTLKCFLKHEHSNIGLLCHLFFLNPVFVLGKWTSVDKWHQPMSVTPVLFKYCFSKEIASFSRRTNLSVICAFLYLGESKSMTGSCSKKSYKSFL